MSKAVNRGPYRYRSARLNHAQVPDRARTHIIRRVARTSNMLKITRFMISEDPVCKTHSCLHILAVAYDLNPVEVKADIYTPIHRHYVDAPGSIRDL